MFGANSVRVEQLLKPGSCKYKQKAAVSAQHYLQIGCVGGQNQPIRIFHFALMSNVIFVEVVNNVAKSMEVINSTPKFN